MTACICCGSELTAPTLINGSPYGYSCAAKVSGGKSARKWVYQPIEVLKDLVADGHKYAAICSVGGTKRKLYYDVNGNLGTLIDGVPHLRVKRG